MHAAFLGIDFNCLIHNYLDDARPIESVLEAIQMIWYEEWKEEYGNA